MRRPGVLGRTHCTRVGVEEPVLRVGVVVVGVVLWVAVTPSPTFHFLHLITMKIGRHLKLNNNQIMRQLSNSRTPRSPKPIPIYSFVFRPHFSIIEVVK